MSQSLFAILLQIIVLNTNTIADPEDYLSEISFSEALNSKYILIIPLSSDYYVDNHWVNQFLNLSYEYPELSVVVVDKDVRMIKKLVTNKHLNIHNDTKGVFFNSNLYSGSAVLLSKNGKGFQVTNLTIHNAYPIKIDLFNKILKRLVNQDKKRGQIKT